MLNKIKNDLKLAMMDQNKPLMTVLRMAITQLGNEAIAKGNGYTLTDDESQVVLKRMVKQRQDSIEQFTRGGALDKSALEAAEIKVLETYLPKMLSEHELQAAVDAAIERTGAETKKDMGAVMRVLKFGYGNSFDAALASKLISKVLL
jgi:uncharacterized protein YqeY